MLLLAICIFVPAWSLRYWQGLVYWLLFCAWMCFFGVYFLKRDPALVERRMHVGAGAERERSQKIIQAFASIFVLLIFVLPGLDVRNGWSGGVRPTQSLAADAVFSLGFFIIFLVFRVNSYTAAIVDVQEGQRVVSTGPYAIVRHPMYAGAALMFLATPIALGSSWAVIAAALLVLTMCVRAVDEERVLRERLPGYVDYMRTVRWRLIPGVW